MRRMFFPPQPLLFLAADSSASKKRKEAGRKKKGWRAVSEEVKDERLQFLFLDDKMTRTRCGYVHIHHKFYCITPSEIRYPLIRDVKSDEEANIDEVESEVVEIEAKLDKVSDTR
ncbi:hypothetical protein Baya_6462 [Bagarius yarrelli]|uniref:Uncharacterized protein n=1 Tax=Bagarius yarrelli TaxID=175774 RepID=A0A556U0C4_BAGYA|nr:hypothetical protein Baya_6462 [Bagarius yarrelli]